LSPELEEIEPAKTEHELRRLLRPEAQSGLLDRLGRYLDLGRWGFKLTYVDPRYDTVVYDSPKCRAMFSLRIDVREGDAIAVRYARSHVSNDVSVVMEWQGESCFAWHNIRLAPFWQFLEGISATEAAGHLRAKVHWSVGQTFRETELGRSLRGPDASVALHGYIWQHYGERLFSLFDIRRPDLWEEFRRFLREYYELLPNHPFIRRSLEVWGIPPWNVC